jgi:hypothetical protein
MIYIIYIIEFAIKFIERGNMLCRNSRQSNKNDDHNNKCPDGEHGGNYKFFPEMHVYSPTARAKLQCYSALVYKLWPQYQLEQFCATVCRGMRPGLRSTGIQALGELPRYRLSFDRDVFVNDPRIEIMSWSRSSGSGASVPMPDSKVRNTETGAWDRLCALRTRNPL